jgi:hypothetical protein
MDPPAIDHPSGDAPPGTPVAGGTDFFLRKTFDLRGQGKYTSGASQPEETLTDHSREATTMDTRKKKALKALTVFLAFSFAQVYVQAGLPNPAPVPGAPQRAITARLTTKNNQPITVNGNSVGTGGTILTGATIETPDQVGATIDLGDGGVVELQPGSKIQLDFDENGNVRVKVLRGCVVTKKKTNVLPGEMEIYTDQVSYKTDKKRRHLGGCFLPNGQLGSLTGVTAGSGLTGAEIAGIVVAGSVGGGLGIYFATRGGNPSPAR